MNIKFLFKVTLMMGWKSITLYIIENDFTSAQLLAQKTIREDYDYGSRWYVSNVEKIAEEGQYGQPCTLLIGKE